MLRCCKYWHIILKTCSILHNVELSGGLKGVKICNVVISISDLLFAGESLALLGANIRNAIEADCTPIVYEAFFR